MADPFSETARATRSISEPLTKAERESLAISAATDAQGRRGREHAGFCSTLR
jgi:hypothetical protein